MRRLESLGEKKTNLSQTMPRQGAGFLKEKGSVAINGTSLTVNGVDGKLFQVCIIPETIKRTNLGLLNLGENVNFEADYLLKRPEQEEAPFETQFEDTHG